MRMAENRIMNLFMLMLTMLASCSSAYQISGNSDITRLDGKTLSLKTLKEGQWVPVDSAEVVHGVFSMNGKADTTMMVTLYFDNEGIMPIVLENGDISVSISNQTMRATGTPLNDALYDFIQHRNAMEQQMGILNSREAQLILEGANADYARQMVQEEMNELNTEINSYVRSVIASNYSNILGPSIFMMMCSALPYPIITSEIEEVLQNAPEDFLNQEWVKDFVSKAQENMRIIEENRRMQENILEKHRLFLNEQRIANENNSDKE